MQRRLTARAIIVHQNKLLCARLLTYKYSIVKDFWSVPGGGVEENESILDALKREIIEELGIKPKIGRLLYVQQYKGKDSEETEFFFWIENGKDFLNIDLNKTTHGTIEIGEVKFIDPKDYYLLPEFLQNENFDNIGSNPVKFYSYL